MSGYTERVTIRIPRSELLKSVWYSDGSGCRGVGLDTLDPGEFDIESIELDGPDVVIVLAVKR